MVMILATVAKLCPFSLNLAVLVVSVVESVVEAPAVAPATGLRTSSVDVDAGWCEVQAVRTQ